MSGSIRGSRIVGMLLGVWSLVCCTPALLWLISLGKGCIDGSIPCKGLGDWSIAIGLVFSLSPAILIWIVPALLLIVTRLILRSYERKKQLTTS
jgi:hypothetical protein